MPHKLYSWKIVIKIINKSFNKSGEMYGLRDTNPRKNNFFIYSETDLAEI